MRLTIITCDICGAPIGTKGGSIDLFAHDISKMVLTTYPPKRAGLYDLCEECRDELAEWVYRRMRSINEHNDMA